MTTIIMMPTTTMAMIADMAIEPTTKVTETMDIEVTTTTTMGTRSAAGRITRQFSHYKVAILKV